MSKKESLEQIRELKQEDMEKISAGAVETRYNFYCNKCGTMFSNRTDRDRHMRRCNPKDQSE